MRNTESLPAGCGMRRYQLLVLLLWPVFAIPLRAGQDGGEIVISKTDRKVEFDGYMTEPAWQDARSFPMTMHFPTYGNEPTQKSDVRILHDGEYLWIGAMLYDEDPSKLRLISKKRDEFGGGSDWFGVILDTYNDNENAVIFLTTPTGLRTDASIFNDAVGDMVNMPVSPSWNTFWDVECHVTEEGWTLEMRIPVSSLRFQEEGGRATMGLIIWRWIPHLDEMSTYPPIRPEYGSFGMWKPSQARDIEFEGMHGKNPIYFTPYLAGGLEQRTLLNDAGTGYDRNDEPKLEAGMDFKYGLTSNMTLDVTVNTDFAQVEADDEIVNLTRFSYYFPEKRQFFLERSSIFEFGTGGANNVMFYSRRIGLNEDAEEIVRIYGGTRMIGRQGPWDIGFLDMQTAPSSALPSENFGTLRLKRRTFNQHSYLGGIVTSRLGMNGNYNFGYGVDGLVRVTGDEYLKVAVAQTTETGSATGPASLHPTRMHFNWERRKDVGLHYELYSTYSGKDFNPGIGFVQRDDYTSVGAMIGNGWLPPEKSPIQKHILSLRSSGYVRNSYNSPESFSIGPSYDIALKNNYAFGFGIKYKYEQVFETYELSDDADVPVATYRYPSFSGYLITTVSKPVVLNMTTETGGYYDGNLISLTLNPLWSVSSSFELSGFYQFNRVVFPERNQFYLAHIARLKCHFMFSTKLSLSAFMQYNSAEDGMVSNARFRFNPREGNDFYIVYNEGNHTGPDRDVPAMPALPRLDYRAVLLKYTYTFAL